MGGTTTGACDAGAPYGPVDEYRHGTVRPKGAEGSTTTDEQRIVVDWGPRFQQIRHNCSTYFLIQGQPCLTTVFAANLNPRALPVDVLQTHLYYVSGSKPQSGKQKQYGPIPYAYRRGLLAGGNQTLYVFGW
jgi:hypothetical protein